MCVCVCVCVSVCVCTYAGASSLCVREGKGQCTYIHTYVECPDSIHKCAYVHSIVCVHGCVQFAYVESRTIYTSWREHVHQWIRT